MLKSVAELEFVNRLSDLEDDKAIFEEECLEEKIIKIFESNGFTVIEDDSFKNRHLIIAKTEGGLEK